MILAYERLEVANFVHDGVGVALIVLCVEGQRGEYEQGSVSWKSRVGPE